MEKAGFLGNAPVKFPALIEIAEYDGEKGRGVFTWTMDSNNCPVKLRLEGSSDDDSETTDYEFVWSALGAIGDVMAAGKRGLTTTVMPTEQPRKSSSAEKDPGAGNVSSPSLLNNHSARRRRAE